PSEDDSHSEEWLWVAVHTGAKTRRYPFETLTDALPPRHPLADEGGGAPAVAVDHYLRSWTGGHTSVPSRRSVTRAAMGLRWLRASVRCEKSGWPLRVSMTAATPSWRPTRRLSRCATSWVRTIFEFCPTRDITVSRTLRSRLCASSTMT